MNFSYAATTPVFEAWQHWLQKLLILMLENMHATKIICIIYNGSTSLQREEGKQEVKKSLSGICNDYNTEKSKTTGFWKLF